MLPCVRIQLADHHYTAVCALPTWPQGHAFSLLDVVAVEALREDPASGLPLWLCEHDDDDDDDDDARTPAAGEW